MVPCLGAILLVATLVRLALGFVYFGFLTGDDVEILQAGFLCALGVPEQPIHWMQEETMRYSGAVFLIALGFCGSGHAQPAGRVAAEVEQAFAAVRPHAIRAHMGFLADDLLEGRRTGTRGYDLAAHYVAAQLEALGLEPAGTGGSYFQPVPLVQITGRARMLPGLPPRRPDDRAEVWIGLLQHHSGHDRDSSHSLRGLRRDRSGGIFTPELERMFPWELIAQQARQPALLWLDAAGRPYRAGPGGAILSPKAAEALLVGAPHSLAEVFANAESGRVQSFELPVQASLRSTNQRERIESPNVVAVLRGSDPRLREEYAVLFAHLDHLGVGDPVDGDSIHNGAYDNASGVAILLEVASAFARLPVAPRRSVLFLAATGEEEGLNGSGFFAHDPPVPAGRIVADINLDMFLMLYPLRDVVAFGAEHSSLGVTVEEAARALGVAVRPDPFRKK